MRVGLARLTWPDPFQALAGLVGRMGLVMLAAKGLALAAAAAAAMAAELLGLQVAPPGAPNLEEQAGTDSPEVVVSPERGHARTETSEGLVRVGAVADRARQHQHVREVLERMITIMVAAVLAARAEI